MDQELVLTAYFSRATTLIDGGWRISFDLAGGDATGIARLAQLKDQPLHMVIMPTSRVTDKQTENNREI